MHAVRASDFDRYTKPDSIWQGLQTDHVRLVKASWLVAHAKAGKVLARRQELPNEAFASASTLEKMYTQSRRTETLLKGNGNLDDVLPVVSIS